MGLVLLLVRRVVVVGVVRRVRGTVEPRFVEVRREVVVVGVLVRRVAVPRVDVRRGAVVVVVLRVAVVRVAVPRVVEARVGVVVEVVSVPRGLLGRCACAGITTRARTKANRVESKIEFFIADALIMTASTYHNYPITNFLKLFNEGLTISDGSVKKVASLLLQGLQGRFTPVAGFAHAHVTGVAKSLLDIDVPRCTLQANLLPQ